MHNKVLHFLERTFRIDAKYFLAGGFWLTLAQGVIILVGLCSTVLLTKFLSTNEFGNYRYLLGLAGIFGTFSLTGLGAAILQATAKKYPHFYKETLLTNFLFSLPISLLAATGAAYYYLNDNLNLAVGCVSIAVLQPIINTFSNRILFLQGAQQYKKALLVQTSNSFVIAVITLSALFFTKNVVVIFIFFLIGNIVANLLAHFLFQAKDDAPTPHEIFQKYKSYAFHTSIRNSISLISSKLDVILLFTFLGANHLAIYTIAILIPEHVKSLIRNVVTLVIPKYVQRQDLSTTIKALPRRCLQVFIPLLVFSLLYILLAPYLYAILFPEYQASVLYSQILALTFPTAVLFIPYNFIKAVISEKVLYRITLLTALIQSTLLAFLTITYGLMGAIIATTIYRFAFMIIVFLSFKYTARNYLLSQENSTINNNA